MSTTSNQKDRSPKQNPDKDQQIQRSELPPKPKPPPPPPPLAPPLPPIWDFEEHSDMLTHPPPRTNQQNNIQMAAANNAIEQSQPGSIPEQRRNPHSPPGSPECCGCCG